MAFTGSATVKLVSDSVVRITGLSLAGAASGTISLAEATGADVECPAAFKPRTYVSSGGVAVALQDAVEVLVLVGGLGVTTQVPIAVVKTGTTLAGFLITLTNTTAATASAALEIYIRFH